MIPLKRLRTATVIKAIYRGADKKLRDKELMLAKRLVLNSPTQFQTYKSTFWKKAKVQLKKESFGKCAYCEANTDVVAHGDVEHYRPKSIYWWLAYTYDNYLYACQICNQSYKSDNFPIEGTPFPAPPIVASISDVAIDHLCGMISPDPIDINTGYTLKNYLIAHTNETALLPNPYFDDPTKLLAYEADDLKEEVAIVPLLPKYANVIKAMEDYYGINRIELKNIRYHTFTKFRAFLAAHRELPDGPVRKQVLKQVEEMQADRSMFAGMNRYFKPLL